jgi:hypothetical protein
MSAVVWSGMPSRKIEPIAKEYLLAKVPNFFAWDYQFEPEPGKRIWIRVDEKTFVRALPERKENRSPSSVGRAGRGRGDHVSLRTADCKHSCPSSCGDSMRSTRGPSEDDPWQFMGEMQKVE